MNLLTQAFEAITDQQLTTLQVKTGKQRMDSTQIASNILEMSRLQLLVEAVQRLQRSLSEDDQERYAESFAPYVQGHSGQYVYRIKGQEATQTHLQQIGEVIDHLLEELRQGYAQERAYQVLMRFFADNFRVKDQAVRPKANQELEASCLQSCDDLEATYRTKGVRTYKGSVANLSETCDPENEVQLITKGQAAPNNTNDNSLLLATLPDLKNPRSAIEGTVREVKHSFPAGKLPVRGLFRMTCLMVTSAAMTNVRRIHHYWEAQRKQARQKMAAEQGPNAAPQQQDLSFSSFLKALLTSRRAFTARPNAYLGF